MVFQAQTDAELSEKLSGIGRAFQIPGVLETFEEIKAGHINRTFRADFRRKDGQGTASYLFQCVNTYVFKKPEQLMHNIALVTEHLRSRMGEKPVLHYLYAGEGADRRNYLLTEDGFWRVCDYIPSVSFQTGGDLSVVRKAGQAFGDFQRVLADFDARALSETIPQFHDTRKRFRDLKEAAEKDTAGRKAAVQNTLSWYLSMEDQACLLTDLLKTGRLPLRVTHNDTKINNILFDPKTLEPLTIVDLDTVMPGLAGCDYGDAIRSAANRIPEDSRDLTQGGMDPAVFSAFTEGFLSATAGALTEEELRTLPDACIAMTVECGGRFLEDYLRGDVYFRTSREGHNLDRARCQMTLAKDMLLHLEEMRSVVRVNAEKYGQKDRLK